MVAQLQHRFFIDRERRAVYESANGGISLLLWKNGRKVRMPVESLPSTSEGVLCSDYRAWEWAGEQWEGETTKGT